MSDPKPLASLSGGLLARKGDARPAIRRAYVPMTTVAALPVSVQDEGAHDAPRANAQPVIRQQQERIARAFPPPSNPTPRVQEAVKAKAAFTLRLDADRHFRLRMASALANRSSQQIVTEALDAFLDATPGLADLVAQARQSRAD